MEMVGQLRPNLDWFFDFVQKGKTNVLMVYGSKDVIFSYEKRDPKWDDLGHCEVLCVKEGHWMITSLLDEQLEGLV